MNLRTDRRRTACALTCLCLALCPTISRAQHAAILAGNAGSANVATVTTHSTVEIVAAFATIDGYVFSRDSMPIVGALVTSPSVTQETRTDSSGYFRLDGFSAGTHTITARSLGFEPVSVQVQTQSDGVFGATLISGANIQRLAYFLDGLRTTGDLLTVFRPQNIEAIEIYRGPSELPPEAMGNACAAVFIWTRRSP